MRKLALAAAAALITGVAPMAHATPAAVTVEVAPALRAKAEKTYGLRDIHELAAQLKADVERHTAKPGAYDGARIELVLADAVPNHPTYKQLGDRPGLDWRSFGVGGAHIQGRIVDAGGRVTPVNYRYYSTSIRDVRGVTTWSDADMTIQRFSYELGRGQLLASR